MKKLFDFVIGNPPFQESRNKTKDMPVYNYFMDGAESVSSQSLLITPGRFLFDAGATPKAWNKKKLHDQHFKILSYNPDSETVFPSTDIKGGVAITLQNDNKIYTPIEVFTAFPELDSLRKKVTGIFQFQSLSVIMFSPASYRFSELVHIKHPELRYKEKNGKNIGILSKGNDYMLATNIFENLQNIIFFQSKPFDGEEYIQIIGRLKNERKAMWIKRSYIADHPNLEKWKVILPKSNGSGAIGEVLSTPLIGHNQTFISIGAFETKAEAEACMKYVKTKFARTMLGILKRTQDNPPEKWKYVPLQNFTSNSDIDWSKSIAEIDQQLYRKYRLDEKEIDFIESHVKEMK